MSIKYRTLQASVNAAIAIAPTGIAVQITKRPSIRQPKNWRIFCFYDIIYLHMLNATKKIKLPNIKFGFNKEWELGNWAFSCFNENTYNKNTKWALGEIPKQALSATNGSKTLSDAQSKIEPILEDFLKQPENVSKIKDITKKAEKRWRSVGKKCLSILSNIMDVPMNEFEPEYRVYFTFGKRIPFGGNSFMFNQYSDIVNTASHEIMHIEFLKKYKNYCINKGLTSMQINELKEILTVILNEDMSGILIRPDLGYLSHKDMREKISKIYKEHKKTKKNFIEFLNKSIEILKMEKTNN